MANEIKLKRGSGSNPSASDLSVGEVALRTDNASLFTKKDDGSVAEIGAAAGVSDGDKGDITVSNSGATFTIDNNVVTLAKMQNVITDSILGRTTNGTGDIEVLSASSVRGIINVADGATNVTNTNQLTNGAGFITNSLSGSDFTVTNGTNKQIILGASDGSIEITRASGGAFIDFKNSTSEDNDARIQENSGGFTMTGTLTSTFSGNLTGNVTGNVSGSSGSCTGNSATATKLATARTIAGVSFDGSANISLNNNAITNGAGYITSSGTSAGFSAGNASNLNSGTIPAARIGNNAVTFARMQDIAEERLIGRVSSGSGDPEALTQAEVRTFLGLASSATTDTTNASNISSGTISDARLPNSISSSITGNSATATKLATARTIAGVSFDGSANISLNNNAITNGAGYITSADGGNAATLDGVDSSQFLRSDANDTASGIITLSSSSRDCLNFSANSTDDNRGIAFNGRIALSADYNDGYLRLNQASEFSNGVYTPLVLRADGGFNVDGTTVINGSGQVVASRITGALPAIDGSALTNLPASGIPASGGTFTGDIAVSGGAGALTVNGNSDIRFTNGNWTGDHYGKIQHHGNSMYMAGGSSSDYMFIFRYNNSDKVYMKSNGTIWPSHNNSADLGTSSRRWANLYVQDMHFSNNETNPNKVDGTWGDWTLQEGEDQIYMLNNRNGKKYKMNLTEIV